ncbi:MAG: hypothetical protein JWP69_1464 [Flaviaesturariibacter sp.]|nr:hypothetical protein [Flaviaesturariibacter sp.]
MSPRRKVVLGTLTDVDRVGLGSGGSGSLPFTSGTFTFNEGGSVVYTDAAATTYTGSWKIVKKNINEETVRSLQITVANFTTQQVLSQYYDDMTFTGTDRFRSNIITRTRNYATYFRR